MIKKASLLFPEFCNCSNLLDLNGVEVFTRGAPSIQTCGKVKLTIGIPFSEITFPSSAALEGITFTLIKTVAGYNCTDNYELKLNDNPLNIKMFDLWNSEEESENSETETDEQFDTAELNRFIALINYLKPMIKEDNSILIYHKNIEINYFRYLLIYKLYTNNTNNLDESFVQWNESLM